MDVTVRLAASSDVARLQEIELDAGDRFRAVGLASIADDAPPSAAHLEGHIDSATAWVACDVYGYAVGYATASIVDGEAHLDQISVIGAAAGHGIGRRLMDVVFGWAEAQGTESITLTTFRNIPWNGPYYERLGFVVLGAEAMGPELGSIRAEETRLGLDVDERVAMRRPIGSSLLPETRA